MKTNRQFSPRHEAQTERNLVAALLTQRTPEELRAFLKDLCTPAELQAMADRWAVVEDLQQQLPYREIHRITGVSVASLVVSLLISRNRQNTVPPPTRAPSLRRAVSFHVATIPPHPIPDILKIRRD